MQRKGTFNDVGTVRGNGELFSIKVAFTEAEAWAMAQMCKRFRLHHAEALSRRDEKAQEEAELMRAAVSKIRCELDKIGVSPR